MKGIGQLQRAVRMADSAQSFTHSRVDAKSSPYTNKTCRIIKITKIADTDFLVVVGEPEASMSDRLMNIPSTTNRRVLRFDLSKRYWSRHDVESEDLLTRPAALTRAFFKFWKHAELDRDNIPIGWTWKGEYTFTDAKNMLIKYRPMPPMRCGIFKRTLRLAAGIAVSMLDQFLRLSK